MTFDEYKAKCERTMDFSWSEDKILHHAILGAASEAGELAGLLQKRYQGHELRVEDLAEEVGDCLWFLNEICEASGFTLDYAAKQNIKKLEKRYSGEGFTPEESIARVDHADTVELIRRHGVSCGYYECSGCGEHVAGAIAESMKYCAFCGKLINR